MANKRTRKKRTSSGARKNRAGKNLGRRGPAVADQAESSFLKRQALHRWPTEATMIKAYEMIKAKRPRSNPGKAKPARVGFTLLDMVIDRPATQKLLVAASLKLKRVRRFPGYILIKTYNLKSRPIQII
jgi:hypothetical protein